MLSLRQLLLIKLSWSQLSNRLGNFGEEFYKVLFMSKPETKALFKSDISSQEDKFSLMINFIISRIQFLDSIEAELKQMGERHKQYGVLKEHYQVAHGAFIEALKNSNEGAIDDETIEAWNLALTLMIKKIDP